MKSKSRFNRNFTIKIPGKMVESLGWVKFDICEIEQQEGGVFIRSLEQIKKEQFWYWSTTWQKYVHTAEDDISKKRVIVYTDADELSEFLFKRVDTTIGGGERREIKGKPVLKEKEGLGLTHTFYSGFGHHAQTQLDKKDKKKIRDIFAHMLIDPFSAALGTEPIKEAKGKWMVPVDKKRVFIISVRDTLTFLECGGNTEWY